MRVPSYRLHRASGQAVVTILGRDIYLGVHDSPASHEKYRQTVAVFIATGGPPPDPRNVGPTVREAIGRWQATRRDQVRPKDRYHFDTVLGVVCDQWGDTPIEEFGPVRYQAVRGAFVARGWCRNFVNRQAGRVKEWLAWLVAGELYQPAKLDAVRAVPELRKGQAPESPKRSPVCVRAVVRTLRHSPRPVRGLVLFALYTGARPGEACTLRPCDINRDGVAVLPGGQRVVLPGVWVYTPESHKGSWADRPRYVLIGPRCQKHLAEYLDGPPSEHAFQPGELVKATRPGPCYQVGSFAKAVATAARKAGAKHWSPYQLRHRFARRIRDQFTEEHAQQALGHAAPGRTAHYSGVGLLKAAEAVRTLG